MKDFVPFVPQMLRMKYTSLRNALLTRTGLVYSTKLKVPNFSNMNSQEKFIFLMSQENKLLMYEIIGTIHKWLTKRLEHMENSIK